MGIRLVDRIAVDLLEMRGSNNLMHHCFLQSK